MSKTVVLMPAYQVGKFWDQVQYSLFNLDPQPDLFVFCENNSRDETLRKLAHFKRPHELISYWLQDDAIKKCETPYDLVAVARQFLLQRARHLDPDVALFIDADIAVKTPGILESLERWIRMAGMDIVGAPYPRYYPEGLFLGALWYAPKDRARPGKPFLLMPRPRMIWDPDVAAICGGCMMLSRRILQDRRLNFIPVSRPHLGVGDVSEDYGYCLEAHRLGYRVGLDSSVMLKHWVVNEHLRSKAWRVDKELNPMPFSYAS